MLVTTSSAKSPPTSTDKLDFQKKLQEMAEELQDACMWIIKLENELHLERKFVSELENGFFDVAE